MHIRYEMYRSLCLHSFHLRPNLKTYFKRCFHLLVVLLLSSDNLSHVQEASMSGAKDEPSCSKQTTPKSAVPNERGRRSKPKLPTKELNDVEKKELLRKYAETDQNLEKFAQAHNMTALNVKSILRSVIKNHRALARVLGTDAPDDSIDGVRITRSKTRALQDSSNQGVDMTSNVPIKRGSTWMDFRFNEDDEYDNEYRPDEDGSGNEMGSDSSGAGSSDEESEHMSEMEKEDEYADEEDDELNRTIVANDEDESMNEIGLKSNEPIIRPRPDSAASLTLNAMVRDDDEPSIDYQEFVNNLNLDEIPYNDDDNEEDPEYMVPTEVIFRDERDEWNGDYWSCTIPQKEMEDLIEDIVPSERLEELANNLNPPLRQMETARPPTSMEMRVPTPTAVNVQRETDETVQENIFTDAHRTQLRCQWEQHVQLLMQTFVGCYFEPLLQEEKEQSRQMIEFLSVMSSTTSMLGDKSAFFIPNLAFAVETCNGMVDEKVEKPLKALSKEQLMHTHPIHSITKDVLSSSKAVIYPLLVSKHRLVQSIAGFSGWEKSELLLYSMALHWYEEEPVKHKLPRKSKYSIIAENCMPWRTLNELRWQYNAMKRGLERNGRTRHNRLFFDVAEGKTKAPLTLYIRIKPGLTMSKWPKEYFPTWYNPQSVKGKNLEAEVTDHSQSEPVEEETRKRKRIRKTGEEGKERPTMKKMRKERRIDEGDNEMEPIVIVESEEGEDDDVVEIEKRSEDLEMEDREEDAEMEEEEGEREQEKENIFSLEDDECAMDSMGKSVTRSSVEEVEAARGEETGAGETPPVDFSHLMGEMSPRPGPSLVRTPSPRRSRSNTPCDKSMLPMTPGKRLPSPMEESMPWLEELVACRRGFDSPPPCQSPPSHSRVKTPGGVSDYVESRLSGYFGTPEREIRIVKKEDGECSRRANAYSNFFGDFNFDDSDDDEEMSSVNVDKETYEREEDSERRPANPSVDDSSLVTFVAPLPVKEKRKRPTRLQKEKIGLAAIKDLSTRRRVMNMLARKAAEDIRSRMIMHSSAFKHIQSILAQTTPKGQREKMWSDLVRVLSPTHREVVYLLSAFVPPSSLPRSLVLSQGRLVYAAAINMLVIIYAYMTKMQRRLSFRQLLKIIVNAYKKGGSESVMTSLKEVLVNDPLLLRVLSAYHTLSVPSKEDRGWEVVDLRKGDEAFNIFKANPSIERVDLCQVLGPVPTKKALLKEGKPLSILMVNHGGEPILRNQDGKYKEIAVMSDKQLEEERKNRALEKEEEKRARQREKNRERMKAVRKAKMADQRLERAKEKRREIERRQEEEERKKEEKHAPPTVPFTREIDLALLMLYNEVRKVTKRAVRKMAVEIPYSTNFTYEQLQSRLDFILTVADEE